MSPASVATEPAAPAWLFAKRFRKGATGWRWSSAIERLDGLLSEIAATAWNEPIRVAESAIYRLGRLAPAFEHVDTLSVALSTAINHAIVELVAAPVDDAELPV